MTDAKAIGVALASGLLFGAGLAISGMTDPTKVLGFLDVLNGWDPTLAFVLAGATGSHMLARPFLKRWFPQRVAAGTPSKQGLDRPLLLGSVLFGVGWGLGGYCPGPALTAMVPAQGTTAVFVCAMLAGMAVHSWAAARTSPS